MLVTTLAIQPKYQKNEQEVVKFYKKFDVAERPTELSDNTNRRAFGIYDYSKKNKLANNTELEQKKWPGSMKF